jgi:hypothetical protein
MRLVVYMLTACGLSTVFLAVVVANAILPSVPAKAPDTVGVVWTTTIAKTTF